MTPTHRPAFDWNQARAFLATAEEGTLSAAARKLGQTQPTMGRQVAALETALGLTLFDRVGRSLVLTDAGRDLLDHIRAMDAAATRVALALAPRSQSITGKVSITASDVLSAYTLPPILARIALAAPGIDLEIVAANDLRDLARREADIAIRHVRPTQPDLTARLVGHTRGHIYGATRFLDRVGRPTTPEEVALHPFVTLADWAEGLVTAAREQGLPIDGDNIRYTANNGLVMWEMVRQGMGLSIMSDDLGGSTDGIEMVLPDFEPFDIPVWLVTHRELHTSRRIRLVFDALADGLAQR